MLVATRFGHLQVVQYVSPFLSLHELCPLIHSVVCTNGSYSL
jgi:hypothetical protein